MPQLLASPRSRRWSWIVVALGAGLVAACQQSGTTGSDDAAAIHGGDAPSEYVLRAVAGTPLPAIALDNGSVALRFVADTLRLNGDGSGVQLLVVGRRALPAGGQPEAVSREESRLHYAVRGDRIEISFVCPDPDGALMSCVAPPHYTGVLTGTGLRLDHALDYRVPLVFDRVSE